MRGVVIGLLSGLFFSGSLALADPPTAATGTVRLPVEVIHGRRHGPNVVYVLPRRRIEIGPMELRTSFVDRIVRTTATEPLR